MTNFYFLVAGGGTSESEFAIGLHRIRVLAILFVCDIHGFYGTPKTHTVQVAKSPTACHPPSLETVEVWALVGYYAAYGGTSQRMPDITHDYVLFTRSFFSRITTFSRNV
jgi:hypothetical protein